MNKFYKFIPVLIAPIISTATICTACSSSSNPYSSLEWGSSFSASSKKEIQNLQSEAINHIELGYIYPQTFSSSAAASQAINELTANDDVFLNYTFYWEWIYSWCINFNSTNKYLGCSSWVTNIQEKTINVTYWEQDASSKKKTEYEVLLANFTYYVSETSVQIKYTQTQTNSNDIVTIDSYRFSNITIKNNNI